MASWCATTTPCPPAREHVAINGEECCPAVTFLHGTVAVRNWADPVPWGAPPCGVEGGPGVVGGEQC